MKVLLAMSGPYRPRRKSKQLLWGTAILTLVTALLIVPLAFSSHQFSDVPTTHVFHDAISNLVTAGITTGCAAGLYCPDNPVTRAQMAAFLGRAASRIGGSATLLTPTVSSVDGFVSVATKMVVIPGAAGATQFVMVFGEVTVFNDSGNPQGCPCNVTARTVDLTSGTPSLQVFQRIKPATGGGLTSYDQITMFVAGIFDVPTATSRTFALQVSVDTAPASSPLNLMVAGLAIISHPFGATGGPTLGPEWRRPEPSAPATTPRR